MAVSVVLKSVFDDRGIKNATKSFTTLGNRVGRLGKTLIAGAGFAVITRQLTEASKAAVQDAKSQALLANQLKNTLGANDALIKSVEGNIRSMQLSASVADDVLRPAFGQLVRVTGDTEQSTRLMQIALDVSAATGRDLTAVTVALGKAYQGNTTALSRLGIKAKDGVDIFDQLEQQFDGAAETAAKNDPYQRLNILFGEISETIGYQLIPILNDKLVPIVEDFLAYLNSPDGAAALDAFGESAVGLADALATLVKAFGDIGVALNNFAQDSLIASTLFDGFAYINAILSGDMEEAQKILEQNQKRYENYIKNGSARLAKVVTGANNRVQAALDKSRFSTIGTITSTDTKGTETQFQKVQKIIKTYQEKLLKAEESYARAKFEINRDYNDAVADLEKDAADKRASIVQESIDRLRSAFRAATQLGLGDLFTGETSTQLITSVKKLADRLTVSVTTEVEKTTYSSVEDIISGLSTRLAASKALLANASKLAAAGFSQTFIEQVVETGADTGNALATAILGSSAEQQAALKKNFLELENVSETGMDAVAKGIYDKMGLATRELKAQNEAVSAELASALKTQYEQLQRALADAGYAFTLNVNGIKDEFEDVIDSLDGKFGGLKGTIDALLAKMKQLSGESVTDIQAAITAPGSGTALAGASVQAGVSAKSIGTAAGIVIDSAADIAGTMAYIQARIEAANKYIKSSSSNAAQEASARAQITGFQSELKNLKGLAASESAAGTVININVKTDTTQSAAMVGKTIGNVVTKYTTTGGKVLVSGQ